VDVRERVKSEAAVVRQIVRHAGCGQEGTTHATVGTAKMITMADAAVIVPWTTPCSTTDRWRR